MPRPPRLLLLTLTSLVVALVIAGFALGWRALQLEDKDARRLNRQLDISALALEAKVLAAQLHGWQNTYALDARRSGAAALDDKAKPRSEFLRAAAALKEKFALLERTKLDAEQRAVLQAARTGLEQFVALDQRVVQALRTGADGRAGEALLLGEALTAFGSLMQRLDTLVRSVQARGDTEGERAADLHQRMRRWLAALAAAGIALSAFLVYFVARTLAKRDALAQQLDLLARTDALTGVANRRAWDEELPRALQRSARTRSPLCVVLVDLDHFKKFNDEHGHPAGDRLLSDMSAAFRAELRADDQIARYGGEEFALLLHGCDAAQARLMLQRLSKVMPMQQSFSAGIVQCDGREEPAAVVKLADRALYQAKTTGRKRAVVADSAALAASAAAAAIGKTEPKFSPPR